MKHLLIAIACCLAVAGSAQTPYNPDSNGDNLIGVDDLTEFLPLWGQAFFPQTADLEIFETGYFSGIDTAFVPETADIVIVNQIAGGDSHIQLPYDSTSIKYLVIIQEGTTGGNLDILGGIHWNGVSNTTVENDWQGIAFCIRNRENKWRCFDD